MLAALAASLCGAPAIFGQGPSRPYPSAKRPLELNAYLPPSPGSTPWAPAWSPDGKWIAVGMSGSIWKVDRDTGAAQELTYNSKYHSSPTWSPDGRWIIYTADDGANTIQLEIVDVETGQTRALTNDSFVYLDPAFSPDGTRVAYVSTGPNGYLNVFVRAIADGDWSGPAIAVTDTTDDPQKGTVQTTASIEPTWMPDGKELLFVSNRTVRDIPGASDRFSSLSGEVLRVPAVANGIRDARTVLNAESYFRTQPDVSVDGTRVIFSATGGSADRFHNLYLQSLAGGEPAKLTDFTYDAFNPRWSPDGEWIAYISNEHELPELALLETYFGAQKTIRIAARRWKRPMGVLSVRTVDGRTGAVVPSRIHLTAADGKLYAPPDAFALSSRVGNQVFHTAGAFKTQMPVGTVRITAVKGFEFAPRTAEMQLAAGEVKEVTLALERIADLPARGWYNGSMHTHMTYEGSVRQTPARFMMIGAAEGQDVVTAQVADYGSRMLDVQHFVPGGGPHPASTSDRLFFVGQEYRPPLYGHLMFFGIDHLLSSVRLGGAGGASLYPTPTDLFRRTRGGRALVGYDHGFAAETDPLEGNLGQAAGMLVDAALGTAEVMTWNFASRGGFFPMYALWNNGLEVTALGGEDALTNSHRKVLAGAVRTYVFTGDRGLNEAAWIAGIRAGHVFVSSGPLVELTVNGRIPGDEVSVPAGGGGVNVVATVRSMTPLEKVLLVFNGAVVEKVPLSADRRSADFKKSLRVTQSGWYHLRAEGRPADRFPLDAEYAQAFTNPIWVKVGSQPIRSRAGAEYGLRWIDKLQQMASTLALWRSEKEKAHVLSVFDEARQI
jgi:hypothetical protein